MDYIIVCSVVYICIIGFLYQPRNTAPSPATAAPSALDAPINYFPEPDEVIANEPPDHTGMEEYDPTPAELPLETMKVRELYKVAASAGIPLYKKKSKATLVTLLRQEWGGSVAAPNV